MRALASVATAAAAAAAAAAASAAAAGVSITQSTAAGDRWADKGTVAWGPDFASEVYVEVDRARAYQTVLGWGGALTDTSAINWQMMNATSQARFMASYWGDVSQGSLGYNVHRVAINSPDYAAVTFYYDDVADDFELAHFDGNLSYDREHVIPFIHAVKSYSKEPLVLFASPWSPAPWMKGNGNMISSSMPCLKPDSPSGSYAGAWAKYIVKWFDGMHAAGVDYWGLTPQNEMFANQSTFESCTYTGEGMRDFLRDHLGPAMRAAYPAVSLLLYDHNKLAALPVVQTVLGDPAAAQFVDGVALHWYDYMGAAGSMGFDEVRAVRELLNASKLIIATEACWIDALTEEWATAEMYALDIAVDMNAGAVGWVEWNVVLHFSTAPTGRGVKPGGPNHTGSRFGSAVLLWQEDDGFEDLVFQSTYYAIGHYSRFVRPGARRVHTAGGGVAMTGGDYDAVRSHVYSKAGPPPAGQPPLVASAFVAADGASVAVVVVNPSNVTVTFKLVDTAAGPAGSPAAASVTIPAHGMQTLTYAV